MELRHKILIVALITSMVLIVPSVYSLFAGGHDFYAPGTYNCLKCHSDISQDLDTPLNHHRYFSCENCHLLNGNSNSSQLHDSETIRCLDCHAIPLRQVTDSNNNTFLTGLARVFGENITNAESHNPFIGGAVFSDLMEGENEACVSCHSGFKKDINFTRPEFIEWDIINSSGAWTITNLAIGQYMTVTVNNSTENFNGKLHIIRSGIYDISCISCHEDIKEAVLAGGHSNEQWGNKHNYTAYTDINSYCRSCHRPLTQNSIGISPYPANPFNLPIHSSMTVSCMDCHGMSGDLYLEINGALKTPPYNSNSMGGIENSIALQPAFIRGYFCIACKNTGNPVANDSLHFKLYTEPQVTVYVDGTQRYP